MDKYDYKSIILYWNNFINCENDDFKETWLDLFMYEYRMYEEDPNFNINDVRSLSNVSSQLSCYLLRLIYSTIATSLTNNVCGSDVQNVDDANNLNLNQPGDINHVVALRNFFLFGIGGRILKTLNSLGIKNISCGKEFCRVLINIFPSAPWDSPGVEVLEDPMDFERLINSLKLLTISTSHKEILLMPNNSIADETLLCIQSSTLIADMDSKSLVNPSHIYEFNYESPIQYQNEKFEEYLKQNMSCDYFSFILLNLLSQLISEENLEILDDNSVTYYSILFLMNCLNLLQTESEIFNKQNCEIIRIKCLLLIYACLNNIFQTKKYKIDELNMATIFDKLMTFLQYELNIIKENDEKLPTENNINYIFLLFYAVVVIVKNTFIQNVKSGFKLANEHNFNEIYSKFSEASGTIIDIYKILEKNPLNDKKLSIQMNIIQMIMIDLRFTSDVKTNRKNKHRVKINLKYHNTEIDSTCKNTTCMWERIIIRMLSSVNADHQKILLKTLQQNNQICCCNLTPETLSVIEHIYYDNRSLQQLCLNFIHILVIKPIFTANDCSNCEIKKSSSDFEDNLIRLYEDFRNSASANNQLNLSILLKHFIKISKILSYNVSYKILADIILPIFRQEKLRQQTQGGSRDIIILCLIIFSNYLKDMRIIKSFYNVENIEHLKDLSQLPETVKYVCCLIKLGIQNLNFIGENSLEQEDLSGKLIELLINNIMYCTENVNRYFHEVMSANKFINLKISQGEISSSSSNITSGHFGKLKKQSIRNIFTIYQVYWNTILQLLRLNSQKFRSSFIQLFCNQYSGDENILFILVYNLLSCILYTKNIEIIRNKYIDYKTSNTILENCDTITLNLNCDNTKYNLNSFNYDVNYDSLINSYEFLNSEINIKISEFLLNDEHDDTESINIYNVNLIKKYKFKCAEDKSSSNYSSMSIDSVSDITASHSIGNQQLLDSAIISSSFLDGVTKRINNFISKNTIFGLFFQASNNHEILNETVKVKTIDKENFIYSNDELNLVKSEKFSKKLLIIFESILCSWLVLEDDIEKNDKTTQMATEELKKLLISHAIDYWESLENGTAILSALQSLLKVAETRNICSDSTAATTNTRTDHSQYSDAGSSKSINIPKDSDGEFVTPVQSFENDNFGSDFEHSEGDATEDSYLTADDGYDADGEIQAFQESDIDVPSFLQTSYTPSSNFRTNVVHENIARIVVEILMNLSERCKESIDFWPNLLTQVVTRLIVIRDSLGGSDFIIKGFAPILRSKEDNLRDFQKAILELITDLNTPEAVTSYLSILSTKNPPIDLLLPRLLHLSNASIKNQPYVNVQFPIINDSSITKSCDSLSMQNILQLHDYHLYHGLSTSFTQSAHIAPLSFVDFKPWQTNGFTVTTWIQVDSSNSNKEMKKNEASTATNQGRKNNTTDNCQCFNDKTHLLSVGTEKLLLTFSLDSNQSLCLNLIKPNVEINGKKVMRTPAMPSNENMRKYNRKMMRTNRQVKLIDLEKNNSSTPDDSGDDNESVSNKENIINIRENSNTDTLLNKTKNMLKKSLSNIHLLPTKDEHFYNDIDLIKHPIVMKDLRLQRNKWMLLCFSVKAIEKTILITITVDGTDKYDIDIPCSKSIINSANKHSKIPLLCIGANQMNVLDNTIRNQSTSSMNENNMNQNKIKYNLSNIMLFRHFINNPIVLANLYAFGPECINFVKYETNNVLPNFGTLNIKNLPGVCDWQSSESVRMLSRHLIIVYSAHTPRLVIGYRKNKNDLDVNTIGEPIGIMTFGIMPKTAHVASFQTAIYLSGGLATLLFLFARIVELTDSAYLQSAALNLLLRFAHSNNEYYTEFIYKNYINLIGVVIKTKKSHKNVLMVKSILDVACDGPVVTKNQRTDKYQVLINTNACIIYPELLISILKNYSVWSKVQVETDTNENESEVLDILFGVLLALVREKHPQQQINSYRLTNSGLLNVLISFCKIHLIVISNPIHISKMAADSLFSLVGILAGAPPRPILLDEIMKLLLLMHRPSDSFITHDRAKFYNILLTNARNKTNTNGTIKQKLSMKFNPQRFAQSVKIRDRRSTMDKAQVVAKKPKKIQRSASVDSSMPTTSTAETRDGQSSSRDEYIKNAVKEINIITKWIYESNENTNGINLGSPPTSKSKRKKSTEKPVIKPNKLLDAAGTLKLNEQFSKIHVKRQLVQNKKKLRRLSRRQKKLFYKTSDSGTGSGTVSESGIEEDMIPTHEYDIINAEELADKTIPDALTVVERSKLLGHSKSGSVYVQEGFFNLLRDFILILPDNYAEEVLHHYVTIEILLVLSSHYNCGVRASIIRLISVLIDRLPPNTLNQYTKQNYWFHLGNQIALYPVDIDVIQSCIYWITGSIVNVETLQQNQYKFTEDLVIRQKLGMNVLIAILAQTIHAPELTNLTTQLLNHIYNNFPESALYLLENGLSAALIKTLVKLYGRYKSPTETVISNLSNLAIAIAFKSLISSGSINVLWDLLNGLTYVEQIKNENISRGIRKVHTNILLHLLTTCIDSSQTPVSLLGVKSRSFTIQLNDCTLPAAEIKTRFDMIYDRAVQFITNTNSSYIPTELEQVLIEYLIILYINGHMSGSNIITWSLIPSRSIKLKVFTIKKLWEYTKNSNISSIRCEPKMIKILSQSFLLINRDLIPPNELEDVGKFCQSVSGGPNPSSPSNGFNLTQALEKIDAARELSIKEQRPAMERTIYKYEALVEQCIESAMKITRDVVELQNNERRILMNDMRVDDDFEYIQEWKRIIQRMTHENAPWYNSNLYPNSWKLDDTEGPDRIKRRLHRCFLKVDPKFVLPEFQDKLDVNKDVQLLSYISDIKINNNLIVHDQILHTFTAKYLPVDNDIDGELIITETQLVFVPNNSHDCVMEPILCDIVKILEIWPRRYQHKNIGLELFLHSAKSMFITLNSEDDKETIQKFLCDKIVQGFDKNKLDVSTQQWREGQLSNWEYLMILNQLSGRTYNDLMQYPVFPWILSDYESAILNLTNIDSYRKLDRPIAIQHKEQEMHYINNYNYLAQAFTESGMKPYHYGSHYSNSGTILHFMVRLPPFTSLFLHYQDNNFDIPDRTFHSMKTTWRLASKDSPTDVKELIPEFFCLPELLENLEGFNFGFRQSGESVNHVTLPAWCDDSARLFILIHRQALESDIVRTNLNNWIDLIFGYKQTGKPAVDAVNVFHPATYYGFTSSNISDPVEKLAYETMVRTYGQMPRQIFEAPHLTSNAIGIPKFYNQALPVLPYVRGLRWGVYTGSPELPNPVLVNIHPRYDVKYAKLVSLHTTNVVYGIPNKCNIMQGADTDTLNVILWGENDDIVRVKSISEEESNTTKCLFHSSRIDPITACGSDPASNNLWFGYKSGRIAVYRSSSISTNLKYSKNRLFNYNTTKLTSYNSAFRKLTTMSKSVTITHDLEYLIGIKSAGDSNDLNNLKWSYPIVLIKHTDEINDIKISMEFKIVVSISKDGYAAIWDANSFEYIRSIEPPCNNFNSEIKLVVISPTLGDIVTIHSIENNINDSDDSENEGLDIAESIEVTENNIDDFVRVSMNLNGKSQLRLHTINANYIKHIIMQENVTAVCYTRIKEGSGVNAIVVGLENGLVRFYSSWNLDTIREMVIGRADVISITFTTYQHMIVLTKSEKEDVIQVWESPGLSGAAPKFPQIVFRRGRSI